MTLGRYDETTALLVVDVQVDFADPGGALYLPGGEHGYSAFSVLDLASRRAKDTDLDGLLRDRGIRRLVDGSRAVADLVDAGVIVR